MGLIDDVIAKLSKMYIAMGTNKGDRTRHEPINTSLDSIIVGGLKNHNLPKITEGSYVIKEKKTEKLAIDYFNDLLVSGYDAIKSKTEKAYSAVKPKAGETYKRITDSVKRAKELFLSLYRLIPVIGDPMREAYLEIV